MELVHLVMPHVLESEGRIVAVSSIAGYIGMPFAATYSAAKHALHGFLNAVCMHVCMYVY